MTIKDFNKQEYEAKHGITKFRNMLRQVQQLRKQIRRDSLPSEYYLQIRKKHIKQLQQQLENLLI